jgi:hypothetical protein
MGIIDTYLNYRNSDYDKIFRRNAITMDEAKKKSLGWFFQKVNEIKNYGLQPETLIRTKPLMNRSVIIPGEMYMFFYDAKHKATLPYWDRFPLIFPFRLTKTGFIGLNMHYLIYDLRIRLMDSLTSLKIAPGYTDASRLNITWQFIQALSQHRLAEPCVHRYLSSHVRSPFKKIPGEDWATALLLPVESFIGQNKRVVWKESNKIIGR